MPGNFSGPQSHLSKNRGVYAWNFLYEKKTSVHIKNMWINQLCNHKVWDFAAAFRVRKLFGTFEKRAPEREVFSHWWPKPHGLWGRASRRMSLKDSLKDHSYCSLTFTEYLNGFAKARNNVRFGMKFCLLCHEQVITWFLVKLRINITCAFGCCRNCVLCCVIWEISATSKSTLRNNLL